MLEQLMGKEVTIVFLDGAAAKDGILEEANEQFVKYRTEYQELYIPVSSIRAITIDTKERQRPRVGFSL
ncbi:hypothetical protein [Paenibacillus gansuensis]|uniref:DUF5678 domain-containing protein n=1 Tax=Paenibacillus gansuensis TaxID=306542 RepID=A0ABW5P9D4_9BACL